MMVPSQWSAKDDAVTIERLLSPHVKGAETEIASQNQWSQPLGTRLVAETN